jgi:hypothetical protein
MPPALIVRLDIRVRPEKREAVFPVRRTLNLKLRGRF